MSALFGCISELFFAIVFSCIAVVSYIGEYYKVSTYCAFISGLAIGCLIVIIKFSYF